MGDAAKPTFREANRRYRRLYWPALVLYCVLCFAGPMLMKTIDHPAKWMWSALAIVNTAPLAAVFLVLGRFLIETDEYTRKKHVEAMLAGAALTLTFSALWGFLELYNVVPHLFTLMLWPIFFLCYGLIHCARCVLDRRAAPVANSRSGAGV